MPPFEKVRMPPAMIRTIDRCQLMVIECAHQLQAQLGEFWDANRARTGVILGHMGATRSSTLYAGRTYVDDVEQTLRATPGVAASPHLQTLLDGLREEVHRLVPPSNENSFPGMMPNVVPARIANYFDLNGLNMTVDTGVSSALAAVRVAIGYLRSGELDMALVGGANGNTTPEVLSLLEDRLGDGSADLAEGTFILALTTEERALEAGLPIHGFVSEAPATGDVKAIDCGVAADGPNYLGAEGALALLRALHTGGETVVTCVDPRLGAPATVTVTPNVPGGVETMMPAQFLDLEEYAPGEPIELARHVAALSPFPLERMRPEIDFVPPDTVVVTDRPELLQPLAGRLERRARALDGADRHARGRRRGDRGVGPSDQAHPGRRGPRRVRARARLPVGGGAVARRAPRSRVPDPAARVRRPLRGTDLGRRAVPRRGARRRAAPARRALLGAVEERSARAAELPRPRRLHDRARGHGRRPPGRGGDDREALPAPHDLRRRRAQDDVRRGDFRRSADGRYGRCSTRRPSSSRSAARAGSPPS